MAKLPDLSQFEMQCLRLLWARGEASVREVCDDLDDPPSYSTVRKIFERLEEKRAISRVRMDGKAVVYRSAVPAASMIRKEIKRFLDVVFDGAAGPLVAHLAEMKEVSLEDLAEMERRLRGSASRRGAGKASDGKRRKKRG